MTVQGPVKEQQPDGMSHGGACSEVNGMLMWRVRHSCECDPRTSPPALQRTISGTSSVTAKGTDGNVT